jgi:DDE family transposase
MTMDLDLETFLTTLYVRVDDLYQQRIAPQMPARGGPAPKLSDSEMLCLGLAAQWRSGVQWKTERGFLRYVRKHLHPMFPGLTSQSAFNRRLRRLWGGFILLQQAVARELMTADEYEMMDAVPVPVAHGARSFHPGWLADIARIGHGGNDRYFFGLHLLLVSSASGLATGWVLGAGNIQDRWLAEGLLSARAGCPQLAGSGAAQLQPPQDWMGPTQSGGQATGRPLVADAGFTGPLWHDHWQAQYATQLVTPPDGLIPRATQRWFSGVRQAIETVFSHLCDDFGLKYPGAHTTWGLITRVAAKLAAYNLGLAINRALGRDNFALATLIV